MQTVLEQIAMVALAAAALGVFLPSSGLRGRMWQSLYLMAMIFGASFLSLKLHDAHTEETREYAAARALTLLEQPGAATGAPGFAKDAEIYFKNQEANMPVAAELARRICAGEACAGQPPAGAPALKALLEAVVLSEGGTLPPPPPEGLSPPES